MSEAFDQMGHSVSKTADTLREFNLKMIAMMRANAEASFDFAEHLVTAKSPADFFERWKNYAEHQAQTLQKQTQELTGLTQTVAHDAMQPVKDASD
jgi:hypothetical protein